MDEYWSGCFVKMGCDFPTSLAMRFNLYQLNQSAGRDGYSNISPKAPAGTDMKDIISGTARCIYARIHFDKS